MNVEFFKNEETINHRLLQELLKRTEKGGNRVSRLARPASNPLPPGRRGRQNYFAWRCSCDKTPSTRLRWAAGAALRLCRMACSNPDLVCPVPQPDYAPLDRISIHCQD